MAKKYIVGNPREIPAGIPIKSRTGKTPKDDIDFYEGDVWHPGPATTTAMIAGWVADGSLIEVESNG